MKLKLLLAVLITGSAVLPATAAADYPDRAIKLIVGYSPGGAADAIARIYSAALSDKLGQPVVVENKPGAGSTIASTAISKAKPDGYTLGLATATLYGIDEITYNTTYTPEDFTPIMRLASYPLILAVGADSDINSVQDFVKKAKEKPGEMFYSTSGLGGSPHTSALIFENALNTKFTAVPYKGGSPALVAVASGDVDFSFGTAPSVLPLGQSGKIKMLGVSTAERSAIAPDLPTIAEQGVPGFEFSFWFGAYGPAGLPKDVQEKLTNATIEILNDPKIQERLLIAGVEAAPMESVQAFDQWARKSGLFAKERVEEATKAVQEKNN